MESGPGVGWFQSVTGLEVVANRAGDAVAGQVVGSLKVVVEAH